MKGDAKMKIYDYSNPKISGAYLKQYQAAQRKDTGGARASELRNSGKDEVLLSQSITEVHNLEGLVKSLPDLRQDKIETIKSQIESNTYNVSGKLVAKSISDFLG